MGRGHIWLVSMNLSLLVWLSTISAHNKLPRADEWLSKRSACTPVERREEKIVINMI
jgi:hypothetical protein